ncbi:VOC family protein [Paenibacillus flagellatus]|uniref:VOC domain-containing protein n=1 Tax=Paenibacillus flagellatus TaxID=2211139 RepID=A0A2V5JY82_9BACL|nr:VOC family protein [Paenibacillus flagellatus]PYI51835.1 hypothetical protein DLM86_23225 [Paenibacillus flagellatus]
MERKSPITHIAAVFLPVRELARSAAWWSDLLDLPSPDAPAGAVYALPIAGTGLILDPNQYGFPHLVMYGTADIDDAYRLARERSYDIFHNLQRFSNVAYFNVFDPGKRNGIMICQGDDAAEPAAASGRCPIRAEVRRVFAHSDDVDETAQWYGAMLGLAPGARSLAEEGCELRPARGALLHILDRRRNPIPPVYYGKLGASVVGHPMFELTTPDLSAAREWVEAKGGEIVATDGGEAGRHFYFRDPDGNTNRVAEA